MLVLDMDDTLLTDDHRISEKNKSALLKAQELGVYVVLASGRPTPAMTSYAAELDLAKYDSYILAYNGAVIMRMKDESILFEQSLTKEEIHRLYDFSIEHKVHIITYINGAIISETESPYIDIEKKITGMPFAKVSHFKAAVNSSAIKCILLEDPSYLKQVEKILKAEMPDKSVATSKPYFLEVTHHGIDKAESLKRLAAKLNIRQEEIIAVGNAENDLSMVQYAGLGVWVDNVNPELRDKANAIVASNNNDGVAEVVERFILAGLT
ncbi:MAG: Cof-type HAD-IIB family hydrolase [Cytophaga sp.]|uniref:Cof-type HAD-IIB family hydrolase n=1 Tax=Cytophaga sp. TaxID=29535 RepID=UPI003F81ED15